MALLKKMKRILNKNWIKKLHSISHGREVLAYDQLLSQLIAKGYLESTIELVYNSILDYLPEVNDFSMYPNDNLIEDYEIDNEDLEDILESIFRTKKLKYPSRAEQAQFYHDFGKDLTLERMIQFVDVLGNNRSLLPN